MDRREAIQAATAALMGVACSPEAPAVPFVAETIAGHPSVPWAVVIETEVCLSQQTLAVLNERLQPLRNALNVPVVILDQGLKAFVVVRPTNLNESELGS